MYIMIMISVFVVAEGMNMTEKVKDGHKHWKMKIVSMHQDEGTVWIVGNWFYSPTDLKKIGLAKWYVAHTHNYFITIF